MRRIITTLIGLSMLMAVMVAPAAAQEADTNWWGGGGYDDKGNLVEELIALNEDTGRYDILIQAVLFAQGNSDVDLVGVLSSAEDVTLFAPTDWAFVKLARNLTGDNTIREAGAFDAIAGVLVSAGGSLEGAVELLIDTLSYHVAPRIIKPWQLFFPPYQYEMLNGDDLKAWGIWLTDEAGNKSRVQLWRSNVKASNPALIHTINNVLIPSSLAG